MLKPEEETFFKRAALKIRDNPGMTIEESLKAVLADDARILETLTIMPDRENRELVSELSGQVYDTIRAQKGNAS